MASPPEPPRSAPAASDEQPTDTNSTDAHVAKAMDAQDTPASLDANSDDHPVAPTTRGRPIRRRPMQLVWIIPLVAAIIGGWIFVHSVLNKGPQITITFANAEALEVGKTRIKYRDVNIGTVTHIGFDDSFNQVQVTAELTRAAAPLLRDDTRWWVVRPRVGSGGVSGLGTLLSGAYIGLDVGKSEQTRRDFQGLEKPPTVTADLKGRRFSLKADSAGSLGIGSSVYYRRVPVGRVTSVELDSAGAGAGVIIEIFIDSPYEGLVTTRSRFWEASGIDIALDAGGFRVNTQSAASILAGGVSFATAPGPGSTAPANEGAQFRLASDPVAAMKETETETLNARMYFSESLRGLSPGAPIDFRGVVIGEVSAVGVEFDARRRTFRFPVDVQLYPSRLMPSRALPTSTTQLDIAGLALAAGNIRSAGSTDATSEAQEVSVAGSGSKPSPATSATAAVPATASATTLIPPGTGRALPTPNASAATAHEPLDQVLAFLIESGFKAQLRPGNLLTGQLYVALDFFPRSTKSALTRRNGVIEIPTIGGSLGEFQASISELLSKINRIPFDGISSDLRAALQSGTATLDTTSKTVSTLQEAVDTLGRELPPELLNTLGELRQTIAEVRRTVDTAGQALSQDSGLQTDLRNALREVNRAAGSVRQLTDYLERHPEALLHGKPGDAP